MYKTKSWSHPGQAIGLDTYYVGIDNEDGFKYVLTLVDLFTKFVLFVPCKTNEALEIVQLMLDRFVWIFGWPEVLFSDSHTSFRGRVASVFCSATGVEWIYSAPWPYAHEQLGSVEVRHRGLAKAITALRDKSTWPAMVSSAAWIHNTTTTGRSSTGHITPYEAI